MIDEQVEPALAMRPDLVSVYAGGNDLMRPSVDIDAIVSAYADGLRPLRDAGAHLVLFTGFDLGWAPLFGRLRGRVATYNELVREVAEDLDATLVDFWRLREHRDPRMWAVDRIHMSTLGHQRMAVAVLDALGVPHDLEWTPLPEPTPLQRAAKREADLAWARAHAAPWIQRRLTGRSSGDGLTPRFPAAGPPPRRRDRQQGPRQGPADRDGGGTRQPRDVGYCLTARAPRRLLGPPAGDPEPPRGCSSMAEHELPKLRMRVRFPSSAPPLLPACLRGQVMSRRTDSRMPRALKAPA